MAEYESKNGKFDRHSALDFLAEAGQSFAAMANDLANIKLPEDREGRILGIRNLSGRMNSLSKETDEIYSIVTDLNLFEVSPRIAQEEDFLMNDKKVVKMVKCPGCDLMLPEDDINAQVKHMDEKHPDIVAERKRKPLY